MATNIICKLPPWTLTIATVVVILWLTLAPHPLGDIQPPFFPGADKIVHAVMFGFLTAMACTDRIRSDSKSSHSRISFLFAFVSAAASTLFGVAIEFLQQHLQTGRSFETADMIADGIGAFLTASLWLIQSALSPSDNGKSAK